MGNLRIFVMFVLMAVSIFDPMETRPINEFENIHMDFFLKNPDMMKSMFNCLLDKGPCTLPLMQVARQRVAHAMNSNCGDCGPGEVKLLKQFTIYSLEHYADDLQATVDKYMENKANQKKFLDFIHS